MKKIFLSISVISAILFSLNTNSQTISTIAGTVSGGFSGDGGLAISAQLNLPSDIAFDASGNMYIADQSNHRIRKINMAGVISTFAGTGVSGFSGDGGASTAAQLNNPFGVVVDASGNVYIGDYGNNRVRKVNTLGVISTFAGTGIGGFSGDGAAANLAQLQWPFGVALDASGNLYIGDVGNNRVRKVNTLGIISTFAGTGIGGFSGDGGAATSAQISAIRGVAVDASGNVYIAELGNVRIRKVNTLGIISTFAGTGVAGFSGDGGAATSAQLSQPHRVSFDAIGNTFIADFSNNRVRKVSPAGIISTFAGTGVGGFSGDGGAPLAAQLSAPVGVMVDASGNLYIADYTNHRIRKVTCVTPTITVSSGSICSGNSFIMVPNGAGTYTFQGGNAVVSPTTNASFTVVGTSTAGCLSANPAVSNITVNALPTIIATSNNSLMCIGETVTLTASGASTYTWNPGGTGMSIPVSPSINTTYTVIGTDLNGCSNTAVITQSVDLCTGIVKVYNPSAEIYIYPNPFNDKITILTSSTSTSLSTGFFEMRVQIFNILGVLIYSSEIKEKTEIDLSGQSSGIYFVRVGSIVKKIIKEE